MKSKLKNTKYGELIKEIRSEEHNHKCARCGTNKNLTIDHIIPKAILLAFNLFEEVFDDDENFQILCRACNAWKANRLDIMNKKTKPLLEKYVKRI